MAASSHINNKLYTAKIVDAKEIASDRGDCWIATSIGERRVKANFGGSEAGILKALFLKMTVWLYDYAEGMPMSTCAVLVSWSDH